MGATLMRRTLLAAAMVALSAAPLLGAPQDGGATTDEIPLRDRLDGLAPDAQAKYLVYLIDSGKETAEIDFYLGNAYYSLGQFDKSIAAFERAIELSGGRNLMAKVEYARNYARLVYDKALHDRLLNEVLAADPVAPDLTLVNILAKREARKLLRESGDYFDE